MRRQRLMMGAMLAVGGVCLACGASMPYSSTTEYTRTQAALVPAPAGPHATGVMAEDDQTTVEVSGEFASTPSSTTTRANGAIGHATTPFWGRVRLAHGLLDRLEAGMDFEIAPGGLAGTSASDLPRSIADGNWLVRGGLQMRGIVFGTRRFGFGLNAEASVGSVVYSNTLRAITTTTLGGGGVAAGANSASLFMPFVRGGVFLHAMPTRALALVGGVLVQTAPRFDGQQTYSQTCSYTTGALFPSSCVFTPAVWPAEFTLRPVGTLWASVSYSFGSVTLVGQFFGNVLGDQALLASAPFGGNLGLRYGF